MRSLSALLIQLLNKQQISACGACLHYYPHFLHIHIFIIETFQGRKKSRKNSANSVNSSPYERLIGGMA